MRQLTAAILWFLVVVTPVVAQTVESQRALMQRDLQDLARDAGQSLNSWQDAEQRYEVSQKWWHACVSSTRCVRWLRANSGDVDNRKRLQ
jgi:hypothetical protein